MSQRVIAAIVLAAWVFPPAFARRREKPTTPVRLAWAYVPDRGTVLLRKPADAKAVIGKLGRGELAEMLETKSKGGVAWVRLAAANPANLEKVIGWADSRSIKQIPPDRFPTDRALLDAMGGDYLHDFVAGHAVIVRFLVPRAQGKPLLVAWVGTRALAQVQLQLFSPANGKYVGGPFLSFPYAGMGTAIKAMEVQDLRGSGGECLVSTEAAPSGLGSSLRKMVIRQVSAQGFRTVWQAPLELTNFTFYPSAIKVLAPAVRNIGAPGTKTQGKVTFELQGGRMVPIWKGRVRFYVIGRGAPVRTLAVEKVCPWKGGRFEPLE